MQQSSLACVVAACVPHSHADSPHQDAAKASTSSAVHDAELDELLPAAPPGANLGLGASRAARRRLESKRDWAHVVDVNATMGDFHKLVPDMAHKVRGPLAKLAAVY